MGTTCPGSCHDCGRMPARVRAWRQKTASSSAGTFSRRGGASI
ncbi:hypothetical protein ACFFX0_31975 [Citricoccus parietis]|uniref:Uncharacterized protein n=1 Tax=Citricoccus parietis TaxID=592307 RepID=A0ABV5G9F2_9MICC